MRAFLYFPSEENPIVTTRIQVELPEHRLGIWPLIVEWQGHLYGFHEEIVDHAHYYRATPVKALRLL